MFPFNFIHKALYSVADLDPNPIHVDKIPQGAHQLPLVHTHNGKECPVSIRNQQRISEYKNQVETTRTQVGSSEDLYKRKIYEIESRIKQMSQDPANYNGQPVIQNEIQNIEKNFDSKIYPMKQDLNKLQLRLKELRNPPTASQLESEIRGINLDLQRLPTHVNTEQLEKQMLDLKTQYDSSLKRIQQLSSQLREPQPPRLSGVQNEIQNLEKQKAQLKHQYDINIKTTNENFSKKKRDLLENARVMKTRYEGLYEKYRYLQQNVSNWSKNVKDYEHQLESIPSKPQINTSQWDDAMRAAEIEQKNALKRAEAFRNSTKEELALLSKTNKEHLKNYKNQIDTDISNLKTIRDARVKELKYNRDNTMYQLSFGSESTLPVLQKTRIDVPVVKPVLIQTTEPIVVERLRATPQYNDVYLQSGKLSKPYQARVELKERPEGDTTIIHSRSVPRLVAHEHERVIEKQEERIIPREKTIMRQVQHTETLPGHIYTTSTPIESVIGAEEVRRRTEHIVPKEVQHKVKVPGQVFTRKATLADFNMNETTKKSYPSEKLTN